jgi:quinoprotein relay system zinc metallohydrolase 1
VTSMPNRHWLAGMLLMLAANGGAAQDYTYSLEAKSIAENTWIVEGVQEHFTMANGGRIANLAFIGTRDGAVVIDSGTSQAHGESLRALVEATTGSEVIRVFITHQHPDHVLGNGAFGDVPIEAMGSTIDALRTEGGAVLDTVYRLLGPWMRGTEVHLPNTVAQAREIEIGGHTLQIMLFDGHTDGDLVVYDQTTGVLFCGDLCFHQRTPTTPNADIDRWLAALRTIESLGAEQIVPGHGPVITADNDALALSADYLVWLDETIAAAVHEGFDMPELMQRSPPARFSSYAVLVQEYARSVMHLFPQYEADLFSNH